MTAREEPSGRIARAWALRRWWLYPGLALLVAIGIAAWLAAGWSDEPFSYVLF